MCNLCRYGPSPDRLQLHPYPQEADPDVKFASFFTLLFTLKIALLVYIKWLKQSKVTYNYCSSIGNTLKACASQNYIVMSIYLMHRTQGLLLKKLSVNVFYNASCSVPCGMPEH